MGQSTGDVFIDERFNSLLTTEDKSEERSFKLRWVRKDKIRERQARGWEIVKKGEAEAPFACNSEPDGTITHNELILMRIPMEMWQRRMQVQEEFTRRQVDAVRIEAEEAGLEDFSKHRKLGFGTKK
jgi:hypothetical protein